MEEKRIIEIAGVKLEVDMRYAKTIDTYSIGQNIKVLKKKYSDSYESYPGIIVGFDNFKELPTIIIAYLVRDYGKAGIEFLYLNSQSKDAEICTMVEDEIPFVKEDILHLLDSEIAKKEMEVNDIKIKKAYFLEHFGRHFIKSQQETL